MLTVNNDVFENMDAIEAELKPLWNLPDLNDEKPLLERLKSYIKVSEDFYRHHFQVQMDNLLLFKGIHWLNQDRYSNRFLDRFGAPTRKSPRIVVNHLYDFVEQWVSRLTRFKPAVNIGPTNEEYADLVDAKISKYVLDHIWYGQKKDLVEQEFVRQAKIFGEAYKIITWDPRKGDVHPDYVKATQNNERVPVLDSSGQQVNGQDGKPLFMQSCIRTGDVNCSVKAPWHVFEQPCRNRENIDWAIIWDTHDVDFLKAKYPDRADKLKADSSDEVFHRYRLDIGKLRGDVIVYEFFHRSTEFLDKGRYIKFTKDVVLENIELPYQHGQLPYIRFTDIDVPDQIRGMSFFQELFPLQHQVNACASLIYKALVLFAHPKLMVPQGSVDIQQLTDDSTIVQFDGPIPPQLMNTSPVAPQLFQYLEKLEEQLQKLSGVFAMSRGEAPSGVRANSALRFLQDQEDKRSYGLSTKYQDSIVQDAKMTLSVAGEYYDDTDGRLARVVGKNNEINLKTFKAANLSKPYDIRVTTSTSLSQSYSGKIQDILDLSQLQTIGPDGQPQVGLFTKEEVVDMLDLGQNDKFKDIAALDVRNAESENEDLSEGKPVAEPGDGEDSLIHWRVHRRPMRMRVYKEKWPPQFRAMHEEHMLATEYKMALKAEENPRFLQSLMTLSDWPLLLKLPPGWPMQRVGEFIPPMMPTMPPTGAPTSVPSPSAPPNPQSEPLPNEPPPLPAGEPLPQ